ncbi:MAG TPA: pyroglutamyl-peptidase I [Bacillota bacterium]|nr:pyroglutamyl-peptidase I [Bacillota bacterium]
MKTILLTGFEPFGGEAVNPSLEAVKRLDGQVIGGVKVVGVGLPVSWDKAGAPLIAAIETAKPFAIISVGQAGSRAKLAVERIGVNICFGPDNDGVLRDGEPVVEGAPDGYFCSLPVIEIAQAMNATGIPSYVSNTAGTYLCNFVTYLLEHYVRNNDLKIKTCFVHIPFLPEQTVGKKEVALASMSLDSIVQGLQAAVNYVATGTLKESDITPSQKGAVTH